MEKTEGRILKAEEVKLQGRYRCDIGQASHDSAGGSKALSGGPQVRLVETHADYAVMEVTCGCGVKTQIRCDYSDTKTK